MLTPIYGGYSCEKEYLSKQEEIGYEQGRKAIC
ncbi:MAG: hypothetical protein ACD_35C00056G0002 [uncultured bacterium]|nr:MAG: hypothetical protein ACD_35C00056G0002 [uncultured bacterium]